MISSVAMRILLATRRFSTSKLVGHMAIATTADYTVIGQAREAELVGGVCERLLLA
jgi:hypothetical protein